jgi:hypothetical protein
MDFLQNLYFHLTAFNKNQIYIKFIPFMHEKLLIFKLMARKMSRNVNSPYPNYFDN